VNGVGRTAAALALGGVALGGIVVLADATQDRPDAVRSDSRTTLVYDVRTRRYAGGDDRAALALWAVCSATTDSQVVSGPSPTTDQWTVTLEPAVGERTRRRLLGCLEDLTIDRVVGDVILVRDGSA
jgi:hypothetical protein